MKGTPLVSVYLVNHNYGRFLQQAVDSVLAQDLDEFELIIIDDGSTDESHELLTRLELNKGIQVVRQHNKGLTVTNNIALKLSTGKYVMRLDADDFLDEKALRILSSKLESDPDLALVFPDYYEVDETGALLSEVRRHDFESEVTLLDMPAHGACTMIRREILWEVGGYDETFSRQDGYDIWLKISHQYKVSNVNEPLFFYRKHTESLTTNEQALLETRAEIIRKHVEKRGAEPLDVLALIPVRGNAMDARSMPLEKLGHRPLIDWTLDAALNCHELKHVMVSTPDEGVLEHMADAWHGKILSHERTQELARINVSLSDTVSDALAKLPENEMPDAIIVLNIEAPFRSSMYISKAIHVMQLFEVDVVIGVRMDDDIFFLHDGTGLKPRRANEGLRLERDDLFRKVGGMTLVRRSFFEQNKKLIGGRIGHVAMDQKSAFTIRTKLDWSMTNTLAES